MPMASVSNVDTQSEHKRAAWRAIFDPRSSRRRSPSGGKGGGHRHALSLEEPTRVRSTSPGSRSRGKKKKSPPEHLALRQRSENATAEVSGQGQGNNGEANASITRSSASARRPFAARSIDASDMSALTPKSANPYRREHSSPRANERPVSDTFSGAKPDHGRRSSSKEEGRHKGRHLSIDTEDPRPRALSASIPKRTSPFHPVLKIFGKKTELAPPKIALQPEYGTPTREVPKITVEEMKKQFQEQSLSVVTRAQRTRDDSALLSSSHNSEAAHNAMRSRLLSVEKHTMSGYTKMIRLRSSDNDLRSGIPDDFRERCTSDITSLMVAARTRARMKSPNVTRKDSSPAAAFALALLDVFWKRGKRKKSNSGGSLSLSSSSVGSSPAHHARSASQSAVEYLPRSREFAKPSTTGNRRCHRSLSSGMAHQTSAAETNGTDDSLSSSRSRHLSTHSSLSPGGLDRSRHGSTGSSSDLKHQTTIVYSSDPTRIHSYEIQDGSDAVYSLFMKAHRCYDLIPTSAKIVIFDTELMVKKAFFALVYNGVRAAPLWCSKRQTFVGMLTITDFIHILRHYYKSPLVKMDELEEHKISSWRDALKKFYKPLISVTPESSLYDAIKILIHKRVHRLPIMSLHSGNPLYVLTHKRILKFLFLKIYELPKPAFMDRTIEELHIGTFDNIATASKDTPLLTALNLFAERRISALPILDTEGRVVDIYAKFDVINLAAEKTYNNLDVRLGDALLYRQRFEGVVTCTLTDTLTSVMDKMVRTEVHRLVIVDANEKARGILSLSDLLDYIVLRPVERRPSLKLKNPPPEP